MEGSSVPAGAIYDAKDMIEDPHFNERKMFEQVQVQDHTLTVSLFLFLIFLQESLIRSFQINK